MMDDKLLVNGADSKDSGLKQSIFFILFISLLITFLVDRKQNYDSAASHVTTTTTNNNWPC